MCPLRQLLTSLTDFLDHDLKGLYFIRQRSFLYNAVDCFAILTNPKAGLSPTAPSNILPFNDSTSLETPTDKAIARSLWETEADARAAEMSSGSFGAQADKVRDMITGVPVMEYYYGSAGASTLERGGATHARVIYRQI